MTIATTKRNNAGDNHQIYEDKENEFRSTLRLQLQGLSSQEPLDPTYKHLFLQSASTSSSISSTSSSSISAMLPKDSLYKDIKSKLRKTVETFLEKGGLDIPKIRGRERNSLNFDKPESKTSSNSNPTSSTDDSTTDTLTAMRGAFTLRESMRHEQEVFVSTFVAAETRQAGGHQAEAKRRKLSEMALTLQHRERMLKERASLIQNAKKRQEQEKREKARLKLLADKEASAKAAASISPLNEFQQKKLDDLKRKSEEHRKKQALRDAQSSEKERLRQIEKQKERERQREIDLLQEEEQQKRDAAQKRFDDMRKKRMSETPKEATHRLYAPIFKDLWDMEFSNLGGTNPFRIVIDKENCVAMGVPDYGDVIETPMNLTYIQDKVEKKTYETLQAFVDDVKLLINNALLYNSDPNNEYHIAAKKMKKKFKKMMANVLQGIEQNQLDAS